MNKYNEKKINTCVSKWINTMKKKIQEKKNMYKEKQINAGIFLLTKM
jgi:hypothetical protein